ncbi:thioredoxin family protein [Eisenibacter elegans]|uniref:thioredoxin family protein n=1 Tax=Eisenibacter elegans TaxID=997 RepID=UPI0013788D66|nr:thioredoxin family protein [Eisenibacter elegans]
MKHLLKTTFLASLAILLSFAHSYANGITFFKGTWEQALAEAKKQNKLLFVDAYAEWCGPCKMMDKEVFPDKAVGEFFNANFVSYKIDVDEDRGGEIFAKYGGQAMPTYLFVDGDGTLVYKQLGSMPAASFIEVGKKALEMPELSKKYKAGTLSAEEKLQYWVLMDGDEAYSADVMAHFAKLDNKALLEPTNFSLMKSYIKDSDSAQYKYFIQNASAFKTAFGEETMMYLESVFTHAYENGDKAKTLSVIDDLKLFTEFLPDGFNLEEFKERINQEF